MRKIWEVNRKWCHKLLLALESQAHNRDLLNLVNSLTSWQDLISQSANVQRQGSFINPFSVSPPRMVLAALKWIWWSSSLSYFHHSCKYLQKSLKCWDHIHFHVFRKWYCMLVRKKGALHIYEGKRPDQLNSLPLFLVQLLQFNQIPIFSFSEKTK